MWQTLFNWIRAWIEQKGRRTKFLFLSWRYDILLPLPLDIRTPSSLSLRYWDYHQEPPGSSSIQLPTESYTISFPSSEALSQATNFPGSLASVTLTPKQEEEKRREKRSKWEAKEENILGACYIKHSCKYPP